MSFLTLNWQGMVVALFIGLLLLYFGGTIGYLLVLWMAFFLVLSAIVTKIGVKKKLKLGVAQQDRGIKNVIANALAPIFFTLLLFYSIHLSYINNEYSTYILYAFIASVAAITADKFGSEIGVLGKHPRMIFTFKKVKPGTSGGVSILGIAAGMFSSIIVVSLIFFSYSISTNSHFSLIIPILVSFFGLVGSIIDSMLGYFEEKGYGNKYTSNFFASLISGLLILLIFVV